MSLKAIDRKTVHQICSGQVVLSVAVAVKELVENALDAGATNIEVRVKEYGGELVEVMDNGSGVEEANFQGLTLKHHTSKIQDFSDLEVGVSTYGFRGEALSSLCALSDLSICTCHKSGSSATKLEYDNNGVIRSRTTCAREIGTTVTLSRLFYTLPVRHKEFHRNKKKEFNKMLQMLQGYCLVSTNVRISCFHQTGKSKKQQVLGTSGNSSIQGNIIDVFGTKQVEQMLEVPVLSANDLTGQEYASHLKQEDLDKFKFSGYISRCSHGHGRSSTDRQFYFFNSRPCDHSKLARVVNEVYHGYNRHQYPCVVLSITTDKESVDVNITPDKRQVMLHQETVMLLLIKVLLVKLFEPTQGDYGNSSLVKTTPNLLGSYPTLPADSPATPSLSKFMSLKRNYEPDHHKNSTAAKQMKLSYGRQSLDQALPVKSRSDVMSSSIYEEEEDETPILDKKVSSMDDQPVNLSSCDSESKKSDSEVAGDERKVKGRSGNTMEDGSTEQERHDVLDTGEHSDDTGRDDHHCDVTEGNSQAHSAGISSSSESSKSFSYHPLLPSMPTSDIVRNDGQCEDSIDMRDDEGTKDSETKTIQNPYIDSEDKNPLLEFDSPQDISDTSNMKGSIAFDLEAVSFRLKALAMGAVPNSESASCGEGGLKFRTKINPSSNTEAEDELRREIKKSDFLKMEIIGQFNLGFIITKLGSDLFIVDQHATDEKYNFERLQRETVIQHQKLLVPKSLELTSVSESVIMSNLKVFEMNGFQFEVDEDALPMHKLKLVAKPVSKNWSMEKNEIDELVFMLSDDGCSPGEVVRPSAVRAMFASRACRSSIMIGSALRKSDMRKLVDHMSEADQPWNCPHGRPTMRHMVNLSRIKQD